MKRRKVQRATEEEKKEYAFPDEVWSRIKTYAFPIETWLADGSPSYQRAWMDLKGTWFPKIISFTYETDRKVEWLKAWADDHSKSLPTKGNVLIHRDEFAPAAIANWYTHLADKDDCPFTLECLEDVITSTHQKAKVWAEMAAKNGPFIDEYDLVRLTNAIKGWIDQSYRSWEIEIMAEALHGNRPDKIDQVRSMFAGIFMTYLGEGTDRVENVRCMLESHIFPRPVIQTFARHLHLLDNPPFWQAEFALYVDEWNEWGGGMSGWWDEMDDSSGEDDT